MQVAWHYAVYLDSLKRDDTDTGKPGSIEYRERGTDGNLRRGQM